MEALENIVDKIDEVTMSQRKKRDTSILTCSEFIEDLQVLREDPFYSPLLPLMDLSNYLYLALKYPLMNYFIFTHSYYSLFSI